ncbi:SH3 domain-containing protein [Skermanella pratensis]|uniref:SH3 domain-containing protein n=1 Tax=Skermanella pratensis TaxID=2233999 RepID=UPI001300D981|nr:SH3 domain-containing protein [Skermanella pratensis]
MISAARFGILAICFGVLLLPASLFAPAALAQEPESVPGMAPPTGLPVPRFVSLRSAEVNVRTGPGTRYPVEWVFVKRDIPVEITAEFDTWRRIRDWEGTEGWVHQSMLSGKRAMIVTGGVRVLRRTAGDAAAGLAKVEPGVAGKLLRCEQAWCEVNVDGYRGWLQRSEFWGVYPAEAIE